MFKRLMQSGMKVPIGLSRFETAMFDQIESLANECNASPTTRSQIVRMIFLAVRQRVQNDIAKLNCVLDWCNTQLMAYGPENHSSDE